MGDEAAKFDLAAHPIIFKRPELLDLSSGWTEHIPFAFLLVDLARPRKYVELGTHAGVSYCAFCQAVTALNLQTRCFAIDTWQGDKHSGAYSSEVLSRLRAHHDPAYSTFSTLMQCTFDEALGQFEDRSVDLLHIDGNHTYEAVKHDFESWRPKLADNATVLLHDTSVLEATFGVHRLWAELESQFPSFEFKHGHGLGVITVGAAPAPGVRSFMDAARAQPDFIRGIFAALGAQWSVWQAGYLAYQQSMTINYWKQQLGIPTQDAAAQQLATTIPHPVGEGIRILQDLQNLIRQDLLFRQQVRDRGGQGR